MPTVAVEPADRGFSRPPLRFLKVMRRFSPIPALFAATLLTLTACDHFAAAQATPSAQPQLTPATNDPCRVRLDPASTIVVETLRAADGSCVPPSNLVVYRCDPSLDPPVASVD